ncbi:response regulator [Salidesulfovibrio brasiliensis]|uniref:response regulator n=1 Tax=Salidesulfovibrio brasiliensis TaxID=221711 RepID=UPI0006D1A0A5|nr:response regulator [Salidesulfovibrio brasiliensis]
MSIACIFSGLYCEADEIASAVLDRTGADIISDKDVVARAAALSGMNEDRIGKAFFAGTSIFNRFSHEKERATSWLRLAAAELLTEKENAVMHGFSAQLPPESISHLLRTCVIANVQYRLDVAEKLGITQAEAKRHITKGDEDRASWTKETRNEDDPWKASLYDLVIPVDKTGVKDAAEQILEQLANPAVKPTASSAKAVQDFLLAARVETSLAGSGHHVGVAARDGKVTIIINKNVLMLERLERELKELASKVDGVKDVDTKVGPNFHQSDIYRKVDFELPNKVLLVDDEREFVQTLSERLMLRDMGSAVAYDGESALDLVADDDPEVIVLDLKMPGIDGIEVLRRVKAMRPEVQVIILTGHGSEEDRDVCMKLGAFAYLHKPVDIETLSETIKKAHEAAAV